MYIVNMPSGPFHPIITGIVSPGLNRRRTQVTAFTLIEVVFSLAICSFSIVGILGLLALGLNTERKSMDLNTETAIIQQLTGEAQVLNYSQITNISGAYRLNFAKNRYFDENGLELANIPTPANYVYMVALTVNPCQLPGMQTSSPVAQQLIFQISAHRQPAFANTNSIWTVDNGR